MRVIIVQFDEMPKDDHDHDYVSLYEVISDKEINSTNLVSMIYYLDLLDDIPLDSFKGNDYHYVLIPELDKEFALDFHDYRKEIFIYTETTMDTWDWCILRPDPRDHGIDAYTNWRGTIIL